MAAIGFVGPGIMGAPMVRNLLQAGHDVKVLGRSSASVERARATGAQVVDSLQAVTEGVDYLFTMLPDGPAVHAALLGEEGALEFVEPGTSVVDFSTISPAEARAVHSAASRKGLESLDAPVSGGEPAAVDGTLSIMVGGSSNAFAEALPLLEVVGKTLIHVGEAGAGQVVKAANQLMVAGHMQMLAEALVLLEAHEVELEGALEVLAGGLAGSTVLERKKRAMVRRQYEPGFRIKLHDKDLGIVADAAKDLAVSLPATGLITALMRAARQRGYGGLDHSAMHKLLTDFNGGAEHE